MSAPPSAAPMRAVLPALTPAATAPAHRPPRFESKTSAVEGSFGNGVGPHQATKAVAPQSSSPPTIPKQRSIVSRIGAHVFFNRRPLDALMKKTKLSSSSSSISAPMTTPPALPPSSSSSRQLGARREDSSSRFWAPSRPDNTSHQPHASSRGLKASSVANTSAASSTPIVSTAAAASTVALQGGGPQLTAAVRPPPHSAKKDQKVSSASPATSRTSSRIHPRAARVLAASSASGTQSDSSTSRFAVPTAELTKAPAQILAKSFDDLTVFERKEILGYPQVYFHAALPVKKRRRNGEVISELLASVAAVDASETTATDIDPQSLNNGFDDSRGDYLVVPHDHLAYRYEVLYELGSGSFGQVVCCLDHQTQQKVAVKIIRNRPKYREQSFIEVQLLSTLRKQSSSHKSRQLNQQQRAPIVHMFDYFEFRNHLCITFELLGVNLYDILKVRFFQGLPLDNIRLIAQQLLHALAFLREQGVIHCDLKPENVLVQSPSCYFSGEPVTTAQADVWIDSVKLVDFGSSCLTSKAVFTYIQSRFYRSPEVMLGHAYDASIDMWSFACILVELYTGHPVFAGENEADQMGCIMEMLGVPSDEFLSRCRRWKTFFEEENQATTSEANDALKSPRRFRPRTFVSSRGWKRVPGARQLATAMKCNDIRFLAFLQKCFEWDPAQRLTPEQALQDPWILEVQQDGVTTNGSSAS